MAGNAAFEAVRTMIELAESGAIAATVTAPIHKEALVAAGHKFPATPRSSRTSPARAISR
jgi:4-hydroxythreonine-4-phosphate dehydrogenase